MTTGLTPKMTRLFNDGNTSSDHLRGLIEGSLREGNFESAATLTDCLLQMGGNNARDILLQSRCFLARNEYSRSLATLEHEGLLSAQRVSEASETLTPVGDNQDANESDILTIDMQNQFLGLRAVHIAAKCLTSLEQLDDCINLLEPVLSLESMDSLEIDSADWDRIDRARKVYKLMMQDTDPVNGVNLVAAMYAVAGKCYDLLENRHKAKACLVTALRIDPACVEALDYLISHGLISIPERRALYTSLTREGGVYPWLEAHYQFCLLDDIGAHDRVGAGASGARSGESKADSPASGPSESIRMGELSGASAGCARVLVRKAEKLFDKAYFSDAYRLARQAYIIDPFDEACLIVYIGSMAELSLKTELFYMAHELIHSSNRKASSWYAVGCYYWVCRKLEHAQKYLQKAVKIDSRLTVAWVVLGHVLAAQEESEHAISAFRAAARLQPGASRPIIFMAKELMRTNYNSLALHLLSGALRLSPRDPTVLNEIGIVYLKEKQYHKAHDHLYEAAMLIRSQGTGHNGGISDGESGLRESRACSDEVSACVSRVVVLVFSTTYKANIDDTSFIC